LSTQNSPIPVIPFLTSISVNYRNNRLIADEVLPRVQVGKQDFRYLKYSMADSFTIPNTLVGRTSKPSQAEFGATAATDSTRDYALDNPIPTIDIENAAGTGYDPEARGTEVTTNLILLDREVRTASLVFAAANYATGNKVTLTHAWDDTVDSTPIADITGALNSMVMRPNIMVVGQDVATALQTHPDILKAYFGNLGDSGIVPTPFLAQLFGLDAFLVGQGWLNTAKPGQTPTVSRVWGKLAALIYRDSLASADQGVSFGLTAQFGSRIAGRIIDQDMGMRGGVRLRIGESVKELITAPDLGYLFSNAHS
jgi:hypothetical protein